MAGLRRCSSVGEQRIRNAKVEGSTLFTGTIFFQGPHDGPCPGWRFRIDADLPCQSSSGSTPHATLARDADGSEREIRCTAARRVRAPASGRPLRTEA